MSEHLEEGPVQFYLLESSKAGIKPAALHEGYRYELWRPTKGSQTPPLEGDGTWKLFALLNRLGLFSNKDYCIGIVYHGDRVAHRSCVFPKFFRFPFMQPNDLQIGFTETSEEDRGRGLAAWTLQKLVQDLEEPGRRFWYLTYESNVASIKVAEKAGFNRVGIGARTKRFGLKLFGQFVLSQRVGS